MSCFARVAANATAIEMDRTYCKKLAQRQEAVSGGTSHLTAASPPTQPLASVGRFDIVCSMYERAPRAIFAAADYVTWWIGGLKMNTQVLRYLHSMRAALRPNLEAIIVHDLHTGIVRRQHRHRHQTHARRGIYAARYLFSPALPARRTCLAPSA
jgi:hypothetical protein